MKLFPTLALILLASVAAPAFAQNQPSSPAARPPAATIVSEVDAREVRQQLEELLRRYPPDVGRIVKMDPTMLANEAYLAQYPALQQFLAAHPEVQRNPSFYLEFVRLPSDALPRDAQTRALDMWDDLVEAVSVFVVLVFVASMIAWLVKTLLNHRKWVRVSRVQTEVHNKLLDRFAGTDELLAYVQTPAGRRFLEAAPIPLEAPGRSLGAPLARILWSVQAGIVLVVAGIGFQFVAGRVDPAVAQGLWTIGVLGVAFGLGFVLAGGFSYLISRRLGLFDPPATLPGVDRGDAPVA